MNSRLLNALRAQAALADGKMTLRSAIVTEYAQDTYSARVKLQPEDVETGFLPVSSIWIGNNWGLYCPPSPGDAVWVHFQEGDSGAGTIFCAQFNDTDRPLPVPSGEFWIVHKSNSLLQFFNTGDVQLTTARDLLATVGRDITATVGRNVGLTVTGNVAATIGGNANLAVTGTITSSAAQWNHTGPVSITGTLNVSGLISGANGITISGGTGYTAQFNGNVYGTGTMTVNGDGTFSGTSVHTHTHSGVQPGGGNTGIPN